jgi:hypothetical protein
MIDQQTPLTHAMSAQMSAIRGVRASNPRSRARGLSRVALWRLALLVDRLLVVWLRLWNRRAPTLAPFPDCDGLGLSRSFGCRPTLIAAPSEWPG